MSIQLTLKLSVSGTSSQELVAGATRSNRLVGLMTGKSLLEAALALHFPTVVNNKASKTTATFGQTWFGSSESFDLGRSLESRLLQRNRCHGGILWRVTWKERTTPQMRRISQLQVSALSISVPGSTGLLRGWPTPMAQNQYAISPEAAAKEFQRTKGVASLRVAVVHQLSGTMPTSSGTDAEMETTDPLTERSTRSLALQQWMQSKLGSNWREALEDLCQDETSGNVAKTLGQLPGEFLLSKVEGQLNPALPRCLMGFPPEFDIAAINASRKLQKSRIRKKHE